MRLAELNHKAVALLLTGLCLVVLVVIALEAQYPPRFELEKKVDKANSNSNATGSTPARKAAEDVALLPLENYEEIVIRPLFRPSRRPPEEPDPEEAQQAAKEAQQPKVHIEELFALNGVVVTDNKTVALLQDIKNSKSLRVSEGERLEGWRVEQIFPESVLFSSNGRSEALELVRNFDSRRQKLQERKRAARRSIQRRRGSQQRRD